MTEPYPTTFLVYGDAGSHKSEFASTFPKPILGLMFDPPGKARPYLRQGVPGEVKMRGEVPVQEITGQKTGKVLVRLEFYNDADARDPHAYRLFRDRMTTIHRELDQYRTLVIDSTTFMALSRFHEERYRLQKKAKDPRKWYAGVAESLNEMLMVKAASLTNLNVVVIAHVNEEKDELHGNMTYSVAAPGKLAKRLPGGFAECYHAYVNKRGEPLLQTELSRRFNACTQIPAPNPSPPIYKELWREE